MIECRNINKVYSLQNHKVEALNNISLTVNKGEIVGVIGKSGAGKSTLIRCVNLLERPSSGQVFVEGLELTTLSGKALREKRKNIAMIFQHFNLVSALTVYDNVALPLRLQRIRSTEIKKHILPLLELVGLSDKQTHYPSQLSGGQKQRVAIARALAMKPEILLCDEATSALDPQNTQAILKLLQQIHDEFHLTILLITHEMQVIKQICERVIVLDHGKIIEEGSLETIFSDPKEWITKQFVASVLKTELPSRVQEKLSLTFQDNTVPLWRIYFRGRRAAEPVIAELSQRFGLSLNILQANLECISHYTMGIMIAAVENSDKDLSSAMQYLLDKGLQVEMMGYVARDVI